MNELVEPFRAAGMNDTEFACLKAIVFFDPNARGLNDIEKIKTLRHQIQVRATPMRSWLLCFSNSFCTYR